ncbi:MAG: general secretion pathway protein GspB [Silanimonas sp.]
MATAAAAESGLGPRDGDLPWSALATGAGDALPAPRLSMHVYADEPARRFASVDGQRRREGDLLQPGMPLLEIRRDGLRVGWQGRVLWVPR